jgi:hypothetical protein
VRHGNRVDKQNEATITWLSCLWGRIPVQCAMGPEGVERKQTPEPAKPRARNGEKNELEKLVNSFVDLATGALVAVRNLLRQ